jgi:hypothetical protein
VFPSILSKPSEALRSPVLLVLILILILILILASQGESEYEHGAEAPG